MQKEHKQISNYSRYLQREGKAPIGLGLLQNRISVGFIAHANEKYQSTLLGDMKCRISVIKMSRAATNISDKPFSKSISKSIINRHFRHRLVF